MTLNDAAKYTKRIVAYFVLFLILYILGENLLKGANFIYNKAFPYPGDPPTVSFGKIEKINIPTLPIDLSQAQYRKELPVSGFPQFPRYVKVYKIEEPRISVIKEENFKAIAKNLGFPNDFRRISDTQRRWVNVFTQQSFDAEVYFETFTLNTSNRYLEQTLVNGRTPSGEEAVEATREFFTDVGFYQGLIDNAEYTTVGSYILEEIIKETPLPNRETLKFVNVTPKVAGYNSYTTDPRGETILLDEYMPVVGKNPQISNINSFVGKSERDNIIYKANFNYYRPSEQYGVYPIISPQDAYNILIQNKASLVFIKEAGADYFAPNNSVSNIETVDIIDMNLAYYMNSTFVPYLQPIYIFKGKYITFERTTGDVYFYLPALDPQVLIN